MNRRSVLVLLGLGLIKCKDEDMQFFQQTSLRLSKATKYILDGITAMYALGDSITVGSNASPSSNSYTNLYASVFGLSVTNLAVSGCGTWKMIQDFKTATYTRTSTMLAVMVGFNDLRRNGSNAKTLKKLEAGFKYYAIKHFGTSSIVAAGDSTVTRSGSFGSFAAGLASGWIKTNGTLPGNFNAFASTTGSYFEWTFTGNNCGFVFGSVDGVVSTGWGTADVHIDGVLQDTINCVGWYDGVSDGSYNNAIGPVPWYKFGLSDGSHTIKITSLENKSLPLDYFFQLDNPRNVGSLIFYEIPYMDSTGYAISPANGSNAVFNAGSAVISSIVDEFSKQGYRIRYIPTNSYYVLASGLDTDHIHPNNTGHSQIKDAAISVAS